MTTRGVIFDMDGVLVDSSAYHRAAWTALLSEIGVAPAAHDFWCLTIGRPVEEAVPRLLGRAVTAREARRLAGRKRELYLEQIRHDVRAIPGAWPPRLEAPSRGFGKTSLPCTTTS